MIVLPQILSGGSLCGSPVWTSGLEILLCEGGDVELGAPTLKQILLFVFDPLTLTLSLSLNCAFASFHIAHSYYMLVLFVCASLVFNHESFI